jgi:hypothetical protein
MAFNQRGFRNNMSDTEDTEVISYKSQGDNVKSAINYSGKWPECCN